MSQIYFTSDTHLGHGNVIGYCNRPFKDVAEMNSELIRRWNDRVLPEDTVYHLGDFAMGPKALLPGFRKALQGRIVLVKGNHDRSKGAMLAAGFDEVHEELYLVESGVKVYLHHQPCPIERWGANAVLHLHGHVHNEWMRQGNLINCGVDVRDFEPKLFSELLIEPGRC